MNPDDTTSCHICQKKNTAGGRLLGVFQISHQGFLLVSVFSIVSFFLLQKKPFPPVIHHETKLPQGQKQPIRGDAEQT